MTNDRTKIPLRLILNGSKIITSLGQIATIANQHYIDKINKIRAYVTPSIVTPIDILSAICKKPSNECKLPYVKISKTKKIIKNLKASNAIGHDES